jgi:hypothetical protein
VARKVGLEAVQQGNFSSNRADMQTWSVSDIVQFQAHSVVDFVVFQRDVVLENAVPKSNVSKGADKYG